MLFFLLYTTDGVDAFYPSVLQHQLETLVQHEFAGSSPGLRIHTKLIFQVRKSTRRLSDLIQSWVKGEVMDKYQVFLDPEGITNILEVEYNGILSSAYTIFIINSRLPAVSW